jgi:hypothetical protein
MEFIDVMAILGYFLRLLGALVFGVAAGWLVLQALKAESFGWPQAAAIAALLLTFAVIAGWVDGGGTLGAFGLGAGGAILTWPVASQASEKSRKTSAHQASLAGPVRPDRPGHCGEPRRAAGFLLTRQGPQALCVCARVVPPHAAQGPRASGESFDRN